MINFGIDSGVSTLLCTLVIYFSTNCSSFAIRSASGLASVLFWHDSILLRTLPHLLSLQVVPGSASIFPVLILELTISPRNPGSLDWGMVLRNQDPGPRGAHGYVGVSWLMPAQWTQLEVQVSTLTLPPPVFVFVGIYVLVCIFDPSIHLFKTMRSYYYFQFQLNTAGHFNLPPFLFAPSFSDNEKFDSP